MWHKRCWGHLEALRCSRTVAIGRSRVTARFRGKHAPADC